MTNFQQTRPAFGPATRPPGSVLAYVTGAPLRSRWRHLVAAAAAAGAAAHLPVIGPHLDEAPYMGVLFIVLTVGCLTIAATAALSDGPVVYALAIVTCGLAVLGYAATRIVAFPQLGDDVGNWLEPLGVVSVIVESLAVFGSVRALRARR